MRMRALAAPILAALVALPIAAHAQQNPAPIPSRYRNVTWYVVTRLAIRSGELGDYLRILENYYWPAADSAHTPKPAMVLEHKSGPWDLTIIWPMRHGPSDLSWRQSPDGIAWFQALVKIAGSEAAANTIITRLQSHIVRQDSYIALQRNVFATVVAQTP